MADYDPGQDADRRRKFYLRREIDLSGIGSVVLATFTVLTVLVGLYWSVMSAVAAGQAAALNQIDVLRTANSALETQNKLLQQQLAQDERAAETMRQQLQQSISDTRDWEKGFASEIRANLSQITQALSDLRTNVAASGRDGKR